MDIKTLLELGRWSGDIVKKSCTWKENTFDINIKKELSPADFEFIYASQKTDSDSHMARRVARSVFIDDLPIGYEVALTLKPSLLAAMVAAINEVQTPTGDAKKS